MISNMSEHKQRTHVCSKKKTAKGNEIRWQEKRKQKHDRDIKTAEKHEKKDIKNGLHIKQAQKAKRMPSSYFVPPPPQFI